METVYIPTETDFKKWVKEAVKEYLHEHIETSGAKNTEEDGLLNRKEIAKFLRISLVTLTDWVKEVCHHTIKEEEFTLIKKKCCII